MSYTAGGSPAGNSLRGLRRMDTVKGSGAGSDIIANEVGMMAARAETERWGGCAPRSLQDRGEFGRRRRENQGLMLSVRREHTGQGEK